MEQTASSLDPVSYISAAESSSNASESFASSSSSSNSQSSYDVFLSFRGPDTRQGIVAELYDRLNNTRGVKTFKDDADLEVGDPISTTLLAAIEQSRFAIVVLSENYAVSTWCLEELAKICECMQDNNRILPLFYRVDPTDVRYQKKSFETAFQKHEKSGRHKLEKMKQWRAALNKVAEFSGWHTQNYMAERELVDAIVEFVCRKVLPASILFTGDFYAFEETRKAMDMVMKALKDSEVITITVHGIGGVGKTTLVEHAGQEAHNLGLFNYVIKIVVSQNLDLRKVQGTLADGLGITLKQESEDGRSLRLIQEIINKKKILIIVDDVWERVELASIGVPSYDMLQRCSCKVIFTTRIQNVCLVMGSQENVTLSVLSEEDSWSLFVKNAGRSFERTTFEEVAKKVARECGGLPIALIAVARALGDKEIQEWNTAARRLEKSQISNPDDKGVAFQCIKLSYDFLKDKDCKVCFLLCCLFPEDDVIQIECLFRYAIGKKLFRGADTMEEARGTAYSVVKNLIYSSLLMGGAHGYVKMHDVIRDTAIQIAELEEGFLVKAGHGLGNWPRLHEDYYSTISLMMNNICKIPRRLVFPKLQILLLKDCTFLREIPETSCQSLHELRVLDLSNTRISKLPQSLSLLPNLQVFILDNFRCLINISIVRKLEKLEILSMRSYITKESFKDTRDLTSLRILDLSQGYMPEIPSGVLSTLDDLEELYINCFEWGSKIEGKGEEINASFEEVTSLSNLRVLEADLSSVDCLPRNVELNPNWVEFNIRIGSVMRSMIRGSDHNAITLNLDGTMSTLPGWFLNVVMNRADKLELFWPQERLIDMFLEFDHRRLHRLEYLSVRGWEEMLNTAPPSWVPKEPVFKNLQELHLSYLDCGFWVTKLPPESLVNLKLLMVARCTNWGNVFVPSNLLQRLPNLRKVFCYSVVEMCYVFGCEGLFEPEPSKLSDLQLYRLASVRSICDGPAPPGMFQALKNLFIYRCNLQGSLFSNDAAQYLYQLEDIVIYYCPLLERIIEANGKRTVLPKLKNLTLRRLPKLYYGSDIDIECPSLVHLYVQTCPHVSGFFSDYQSKKEFQRNVKIIERLLDSNHLNNFAQFPPR